MYWHVAWQQMDGLGDSIPLCHVFPSLSGIISHALLFFTLSFMCPPLSLCLSPIDVAFMICFYDLCVFCLSPSTNLSLCCREEMAD